MKVKKRKSGEAWRTEQLSPELELVLLCGRARTETSSSMAKERVCELLSGRVNWPELLATAIQHRMSPVLYEAVADFAKHLIAPSQLVRLRETAQVAVNNGMVLVGELLDLHELFDVARIPAIPYKGPVLAWLGYGSFVRREYVDLDFAVPQKYIPQAVSVLESAGYRPLFEAREVHAGANRYSPGEYSFMSCKQAIRVELHTERTLRYLPVPLDFADITTRLRDFDIAGHSLRTFSIEDSIVILSVHGAKHFWEKLIWVLDIAQLVTWQSVDWERLLVLAKKMKCERVLHLGLYLAHELFGALLPHTVLQDLLHDKQAQRLAASLRDQYAGISDSRVGVMRRAAFRARSFDRIVPGALHTLRLAISPTESDRRAMRVPDIFSPLYIFARPWRLIREYGLRSGRRLKPDLAIDEPTPADVVERMLRLARISSGDVLYDLGCGDGRIVVAAAKMYGIHAVGIDTSPARIRASNALARRQGVEHLVEFRLGDAKKIDFSEATVVTLFLGADANLRLAGRLRSELKSGSRIISRNFQIYGWVAEQSEIHTLPSGISTSLYLWTIDQSGGESSNAKAPCTELSSSHKMAG